LGARPVAKSCARWTRRGSSSARPWRSIAVASIRSATKEVGAAAFSAAGFFVASLDPIIDDPQNLGAADLRIAQEIYAWLTFARLLGIIQENCCYGIAATGLCVFRVAEHRGQKAKRKRRGLILENAGLPN
jgi:hypothetical protein